MKSLPEVKNKKEAVNHKNNLIFNAPQHPQNSGTKALSSWKFLQLFCLKQRPGFHLGTSISSALMSQTVLGIILPRFLEVIETCEKQRADTSDNKVFIQLFSKSLSV